MKSLILIFFISFAAEKVVAQVHTSQDTPKQELKIKEMVIMYKGNVWHRQNGYSTLAGSDVVIAGIRVKPDGTIIFPNDSTSVLKEGDYIEENGRLSRSIK